MSATAYVRHHDVKLSLSANGSSTPATVQRIADLGRSSKVSIELSDGHKLDAHSPNDQIMVIHEGSVVFVDLRNAKVFSPKGATPFDELAAV